jgi:hypothetical protein
MENYTVVHSIHFIEFIKEINQKLSEGYKCQDGVCVISENHYTHYYQALTKS